MLNNPHDKIDKFIATEGHYRPVRGNERPRRRPKPLQALAETRGTLPDDQPHPPPDDAAPPPYLAAAAPDEQYSMEPLQEELPAPPVIPKGPGFSTHSLPSTRTVEVGGREVLGEMQGSNL